jgi:hypothetical protein
MIGSGRIFGFRAGQRRKADGVLRHLLGDGRKILRSRLKFLEPSALFRA